MVGNINRGNKENMAGIRVTPIFIPGANSPYNLDFSYRSVGESLKNKKK